MLQVGHSRCSEEWMMNDGENPWDILQHTSLKWLQCHFPAAGTNGPTLGLCRLPGSGWNGETAWILPTGWPWLLLFMWPHHEIYSKPYGTIQADSQKAMASPNSNHYLPVTYHVITRYVEVTTLWYRLLLPSSGPSEKPQRTSHKLVAQKGSGDGECIGIIPKSTRWCPPSDVNVGEHNPKN